MNSVTVVLGREKWVTLEGSWAQAWKERWYELWQMYQEQKIRDQLRSRG